jgi:hypothetical protein
LVSLSCSQSSTKFHRQSLPVLHCCWAKVTQQTAGSRAARHLLSKVPPCCLEQ